MTRLGIYGGSFDPIHCGHVAVACAVRDQHQLDELWFMPADQPPHKQRRLASAADRLAMIRAAIRGEPGLAVSERELDRGGISFTVDTLREISGSHPNAELFLVIGADSVSDLRSWRELDEIFRLARLVVVNRPGEPETSSDLSAEQRDQLSKDAVHMDPWAVSSTEIRDRCRAGESLDDLVPAGVQDLILSRGLYL